MGLQMGAVHSGAWSSPCVELAVQQGRFIPTSPWFTHPQDQGRTVPTSPFFPHPQHLLLLPDPYAINYHPFLCPCSGTECTATSRAMCVGRGWDPHAKDATYLKEERKKRNNEGSSTCTASSRGMGLLAPAPALGKGLLRVSSPARVQRGLAKVLCCLPPLCCLSQGTPGLLQISAFLLFLSSRAKFD